MIKMNNYVVISGELLATVVDNHFINHNWLNQSFMVVNCGSMLVLQSSRGGATAATVDTIQHEEQWSPAGIGCLSDVSAAKGGDHGW